MKERNETRARMFSIDMISEFWNRAVVLFVRSLSSEVPMKNENNNDDNDDTDNVDDNNH